MTDPKHHVRRHMSLLSGFDPLGDRAENLMSALSARASVRPPRNEAGPEARINRAKDETKKDR